MTGFLKRLAWSLVGLVLGAVAGATAGYRHHAYRPTSDVVIHKYVSRMRAAAPTN